MPAPFLDFAIALSIGALIGVEREKRKAETGFGGLRTFLLLSEAGALAAWLSKELGSHWIFVGIGLGVAAMVVAAYSTHSRLDREFHGITTEVAALVVFLIGGAILYGHRELGVALGIATAAFLAFKQPLHRLVDKLAEDDIYAALKLLLATFVVLPVIPDQTIDPWGAVNPYKLWWLVILISSMSLVGYILSRLVGTRWGTALSGLLGGLVSSTAVALALARRSREADGVTAPAGSLAAGILLSWAVMFLRMLVAVAVVHAALLELIARSLGILAVLAALLGLGFQWRATRSSQPPADVPLKNPFSLTAALRFALLFTAVLVIVKLTEGSFPGQGLYLVAALAGLTDVDAITLSMAEHAKAGGNAGIAAAAIGIAALANTLVKCGLVLALGSSGLKWRVALATVALMAVASVLLLL